MSRSRIWIFLFLPLIELDFEPSGGEKHSLIYIYTTFSKNPDLPGLHQFTAMGLLDGKTVNYFDSDTRKMEPRQEGMKDRLDAGYWVQKTESCKSKEQQFMDITQTLKDRLRQNDNDMHVLQRIHGCEGTLTDGRLKLSRGIDRYGYDGQDLLYFNETNSRWVADLVAAKEIERKWNKEPGMKDRMEIYLHNECMGEMSEFLGYEEEQLKNASPPEVFIFSKKTSDPSIVQLTCFTTGFYQKEIDLNIKRDGRVLTLEDGVKSSGIRPNEDDTYQRRDMVKILQTDTAKYSCEVIHRASKLHVEKQWDGVLPDDSNWDLIIGVLGGLVLLVVVLVLGVAFAWLKRHGPFKSCLRPRRVSDSSINSRVRNLTDGSGQPLVFLSQKHESSAPPDVVLSSKKTSDSSTVLLICFATGFYPNDIELNIKRDGRILTLEDGVMSLVIRPNGDDTYQRIDSVKILRTDTANYSCEVIHRASELHVEKQWEVRSRSWECRHTDSSDEE